MKSELDLNPRNAINTLIEKDDLRALLEKAGELHGHYCPFIALGVKAGTLAMQELKEPNTGFEEIVAIISTNNCFSDGIQITTGCTFGNNALIYKDHGITTFTLASRAGKAIRIDVLDDAMADVRKRHPETMELRDKLVKRREKAAPGEREKLSKLWGEIALEMIDAPADKVFKIERIELAPPRYAPMLDSVNCSKCGVRIMESKARIRGGKPVCLECSDEDYYFMDGYGISFGKLKQE
jgi:formylmethanofuran dehydrogenase subunit E